MYCVVCVVLKSQWKLAMSGPFWQGTILTGHHNNIVSDDYVDNIVRKGWLTVYEAPRGRCWQHIQYYSRDKSVVIISFVKLAKSSLPTLSIHSLPFSIVSCCRHCELTKMCTKLFLCSTRFWKYCDYFLGLASVERFKPYPQKTTISGDIDTSVVIDIAKGILLYT